MIKDFILFFPSLISSKISCWYNSIFRRNVDTYEFDDDDFEDLDLTYSDIEKQVDLSFMKDNDNIELFDFNDWEKDRKNFDK